MKHWKFLFVLLISLIFTFSASAQDNPKVVKLPPDSILPVLKASPAFSEVILRKTELLSEVEALLVAYTEEYPRVKEIRFELDVLNTELNRLLKLKPEEKEKLSFALGKLIIRKAELEAGHQTLKLKYGDEHPDVKRARRKVEIYEKGIRDILG